MTNTAYMLLIEISEGETVAVGRFPSVAAARDWEDEHEMELGNVVGCVRIVGKQEALRG